MQPPRMHVPPVQALPHDPQFALSVCVLTHVPPQLTSGEGQMHWPPAQIVPPVHLIPQPPQLFGSVFV